ncbi:MAG: hypothetical protein ACLQPV_06810 [Vulcanimicrobiaceae bacterium]
MKRFDFLRDGDSSIIETVRESLAAPALRGPLSCAAVLAIVFALGAAVETVAIRGAQNAARADEAKYAQAQAAMVRVRPEEERTLLESETIDRLRSLRDSGPRVAAGLVRLANALPRAVWLTAVDGTADGYTVSGEAPDVAAVGEVFPSLTGLHPVLGRIDAATRSEPVRFVVSLEAWP